MRRNRGGRVMRKRILSLLLALALLVIPARAVGETVRVLTRDGPVWLAVRGSGDAAELVHSDNGGKTWSATGGYDSGAGNIQDIQYTGRDYFLTGFWCKFAYVSEDGVSWSALPGEGAGWFRENAAYITNGLAGGEYQLLWTGSEYMMRQSIKGDPRSTHNLLGVGDSPRNKVVTLLDQSFQIIGEVTFDGEVEGIRYADGIYYATVGGVERSFTRADWEKRVVARDFYADGTVILRREADEQGIGSISYSYDGQTWQAVPSQEDREDGLSYTLIASNRGGPVIVPTGRGFFNVGITAAESRATTDGVHWFSLADKRWLTENANAWPYYAVQGTRTFQLVWTGGGYLARMDVHVAGPGEPAYSAGNTKAFFLDENYELVREHDFGAQVLEVASQDGVCYARVEQETGAVIYASRDGERWTETELAAIPSYTDGGRRALEEGDLYAGKYALRQTGDKLLVSDDGVYFAPLDTVSKYVAADAEHPRVWVYDGAEGVVVRYSSGYYALASDQWVGYTDGALEAAIAAAFPGPRYYVTLDGTYLSFDAPPYERAQHILVPLRGVSEALGFTVDYDEKGVTCTKGDTVVAVEFGTTDATVNGAHFTLDVGVELYRYRTYVPLRFFSEQMGLDVDWDGETGTVILATRA
jgi:hypothetical protein